MNKKLIIHLCISSLLLFFVVVIPAHALIDPGLQGDYAAGSASASQSQKTDQPCFTSASGIMNIGGTALFTSQKCAPQDLVDFINALDNFFYRLAVVLAVLMVTIGGMQWLMAIGNSSKISQAKETIQQALLGLVLAFTAILLFNQIDTSFTNLQPPGLASDATFACPQIKDPITCIEHQLTPACRWRCTDPVEAAKPVLPPNTTMSSDFRNPYCIPGVCETSGEPAGATDLQTCSADYYQNPTCKESVFLGLFKECMQKSPFIDLGTITTTGGTHAPYSCHYGGHDCKDGGHAIDFGNEKNWPIIKVRKDACELALGNEAVTCYFEDKNSKRYSDFTDPAVDHIHCNVAVEDCGCN